MSQINFVLLICGNRGKQHHVLLDIVDDKDKFPLYEVTLTSQGFAQEIKILPQGSSHPFNYHGAKNTVDSAIDDIQSLSNEDIERITSNQLSQLDNVKWEQFDDDCYQYIDQDLDEILNMGSPDPFGDETPQSREHGVNNYV